MGRAIVITTINHPNSVMQSITGEAFNRGISVIIVGDKKTPLDFKIEHANFLSLEMQNQLFGEFSTALKVGHYSRKNLGYLQAIKSGIEIIQETDDDNQPLSTFWNIPEPPSLKIQSKESSWFNVYSMFSNELIWPRGFPLENIKINPIISLEEGKFEGLIYQGLANLNPDVDAIYRMTKNLPHNFIQNKTVLLGEGVWCPFNSQNTIFFPQAYTLLYLPSYCSFRMTDIWRSFVAQRCLWEIGSGVVFHSATVNQERNEHNLLKDFIDEIPGYTFNNIIKVALENIRLDKDDMFRNLSLCYEILINKGFLEKSEKNLVRLWINELEKIQH